ncbi:hypothetical protein V1505DRAFT_423788 [Lipomyces doorenjongii]
MTGKTILRVGIIGCGEVSQVVHIPTLNFLSDFFQITYLCDVSQQALLLCQKKVTGEIIPRITKDPHELCSSDDVDVVYVVASDEYHCYHAVIALENDKDVLIEKPMALNLRDADAIIAAENKSKGQVMVGYMRRYAPVFEDAVKEMAALKDITYARIRDFVGPNDVFVSQSGTFPKRFADYTKEDQDDRSARSTDIVYQGLTVDCGVPVLPPLDSTWRLLNGLGSHDLSLMREAFGMPHGVIGSRILEVGRAPFITAQFDYGSFVCTYETAIDNIPRFDACIEVFSLTKTIRVQYDTPYVKGLPIVMIIQENVDGEYQQRIVRKTYEDPYTVQAKKLHAHITEGKKVKTVAEDAKLDLEIFKMIIQNSTQSK